MSTAIRSQDDFARPRPRSVSPPVRAQKANLGKLMPLVAVFYSFLFLSPEVALNVAGLNFPSYRLALMAMTLPAILLILNNPRFRVSPIDIAVFLASCWILLSFTIIYGPQQGIVRGMGILFDFFLPYLLARASIYSPQDVRYFLLLCLPGLAFAAGAMAIESLSGRLLLRPAFASVFGGVSRFSGGEAVGDLLLRQDFRLGFLRAYGPFAHPILGGVVLASFLPIFYFSGLRSWPLALGIAAALAGFFSLSSAALLALMIAIAAILINAVKGYFPRISWWFIVTMLAAFFTLLHLFSNSGIIGVISRLTLSPTTASYRQLIWEYGLNNVAANPWFGLGYEQWERLYWMGESVDAHFLLLAMRHGVAVPLLLILAMIYGALSLALKMNNLGAQDRHFMVGMNVSIVVIFITAQTVNYFGSASIVFMAVLGFLAAMVIWTDDQIFEQRAAQARFTAFKMQRDAAFARAGSSATPNPARARGG